jgi:glycogen(starch) synthase
MRVSIAICTLNRAASLEQTLECLQRQTYTNFEVVVVNGPSTDGTDEVLMRHRDRIRVDRCPAPNLSMSRNIAIRASAGDIIAFIDDDALPEFDWLEQALPAFADDEVAGCGGIVFDHTGMALQYRYSAANRFGEPTWSEARPYDDLCAPGAFTFPYLQGTNALFRRTALEQVGGFDETFDYYLDETDLCCRIVDAGYVLRQLPDAPVHHKFLPSGIRDHQRVVTNWFPIVKNHTYFGFRHAVADFGEDKVMERAEAFLDFRVEDARHHEHHGRLPAGSGDRAAAIGRDALERGIELGRERCDLALGPVHWPRPTFRPYPVHDRRGGRRYVLVSAGYGENMTGGVARYTTDIAAGLAAGPDEVRVITTGTTHSTVDLEHGIWVHRLVPEPAGSEGVEPETSPSINDFTTAVATEVERIGTWAPVDLVYGALWDVEQLGVLRRTGVPTMVHLVTPAAVAAEQAGFMADPGSRGFIEHLMSLEREVLETADLLHANGNPVVSTLRSYYGRSVATERVQVVPLGLQDSAPPAVDAATDGDAPTADELLDVLFVGRLEARKGIDLFLATVETLAPHMPHVRWTVVGADTPLQPGEELVGRGFLLRHASTDWIERVRFAGPVGDAALHQHYAGTDLVVLPSRYESFGLVMLEAMMHGKALVSSEVGGIVEVVRKDLDGILVAPDDGAALTAAVRELLFDSSRRRELGRTGRQRFLDFFEMGPATARFAAAAARLWRHDPHALALDHPDTSVRVDHGHQAVILRDGQALRFDLDGHSRWRIALQGNDAGVAEITSRTDARTVVLCGTRVSRLDVEPGPTTVRAVSGTVRIVGFVELRAAS